jgi:hypothetical protein
MTTYIPTDRVAVIKDRAFVNSRAVVEINPRFVRDSSKRFVRQTSFKAVRNSPQSIRKTDIVQKKFNV